MRHHRRVALRDIVGNTLPAPSVALSSAPVSPVAENLTPEDFEKPVVLTRTL